MGLTEGIWVGSKVGSFVGSLVGSDDGVAVESVGGNDGCNVGISVG